MGDSQLSAGLSFIKTSTIKKSPAVRISDITCRKSVVTGQCGFETLQSITSI